MNASESTKTLSAAFVKFQGSLENVNKNATNPAFGATRIYKYADLAAIIEEIRPKLAANGLAVMQWPTETPGELVTRLLHESGEWMEFVYHMQPENLRPQTIGLCITYARRYALSAILGIAADDDDGNAASGKDAGEMTDKKIRTVHDLPPTVTNHLPPRSLPADLASAEQRAKLLADVTKYMGDQMAADWWRSNAKDLGAKDNKSITVGILQKLYQRFEEHVRIESSQETKVTE